MASPIRKRSYDTELNQSNTQQGALDVAPLNVVPCSGTPVLPRNDTSTLVEREAQATMGTGVRLTGTATMLKAGPIAGLVDIGESEDSYIFRVSLLGVPQDHDEFMCEIQPSGKVTIEGVMATGEKIVHRFFNDFEMLSGNLCPPGNFSISIQLPGPVNHHQFSGLSSTNGTLEGIVKKSF